MKFEEQIIALVQGLTNHALTQDRTLQQRLVEFDGVVLRASVVKPYLNLYLCFAPDGVEFTSVYEGPVVAGLDLDARALLRALFAPDVLIEQPLDDLLTIDDQPALSLFLIDLVRQWDLWNLLLTLCSEFLPFAKQDLTQEELVRLRLLLDHKFGLLGEQYAHTVKSEQHQEDLLLHLQQQLRHTRHLMYLITVILIAFATSCTWMLIHL